MALNSRTYTRSAQRRQDRTPKQSFTKLAVGAIDFGTTFSGYAYSLRSDFQKNPLQIYSFPWLSDEINTVKTPTCVLFDKECRFDSFGYEAESKYADLADEDQHQGWRFFKHFKMMLMPKGTRRLKKNVKLKDDQGQEMLALDVFSYSIGFLKNELLQHVTDAVKDFRQTDIHWVITVPAIWEDSAKQFMREAANKAGIENEQLTLALEPEGAAVFCKEIAVKRVEETKDSAALSAFQPGAKFLLLDLGGGTVDITIEQVTEDGTLSEIHHPDGGPWGGTLVDKAFKEFLLHIFGQSVMQSFSESCKADELYLYRNLEGIKKKTVRGSSQKRILRIPASLVACAKNAATVKHKIEQSEYNGRVELKPTKDKLAIDENILADMFYISSTNIVRQLKQLFSKPEIKGIKTVILVGGFAESPLIANDVRVAFPDKQVIVPQEASLAVLKGAVLYGHNPKSITSRKMAFTYGISTAVPFDRRCHPEHKKVIRDDIAKCEDVFHVFFEVGQTVIPDKTKAVHSFYTPNLTVANIEIYRTKERQPRFVSDEGCSNVGVVELQLGTTTPGDQNLVEVAFHAGLTELMVQAKQLGTNNRIGANFKFLK